MATQISTAAGNVMRGVESDKMKSLQKTTTNISKPLLRATQTVSALNTYNYGRTQQGDKPSTAAVRAATVPVVSGALAAKVGKELIKRRLPKWAIPAAAATYGAAEPALNYTFNKVKEFMKRRI